MPPIIHDNDSDDEVEPIEVTGDSAMTANGDNEEDEDEDGSEGEDGEEDVEEFVVEKIENHAWDAVDKIWKYETRWQGYPDLRDRTWEPKENLEGAQESLDEYWAQIGGEPDVRGPSAKKRGRPSGVDSDTKKARMSPAVAGTKSGRGRKSEILDDAENWGPGDEEEWQPPKAAKDAWEELLLDVETIEPDDAGNNWAYLRWSVIDSKGKNRHTKHPLAAVYKAAPQVMLKFYERHLVFSDKKK